MPKDDSLDSVDNGDIMDESDSWDDTDDEDYLEEVKGSRSRPEPSPEEDSSHLAHVSHITSHLFEIVVMRKHASLSTCLQRLYLTLTSNERHAAVADILSFICECSGFKHSSITASVVEALDNEQRKYLKRGSPSPASQDKTASSTANQFSGDHSEATDGGTQNPSRKRTRRNASVPSDRDDCTHDTSASIDNGNCATGYISDVQLDDSSGAATTRGTNEPSSTTHPEISYDTFDWWYFHNMFKSLPMDVAITDIATHCKHEWDSYKLDNDGTLFFPDVNDLLANRRTRCLSSAFLQLCSERVKRLNAALKAQDGWTIGFGRRNQAYLRFKEFFQQFIMEVEPKYLGDILHVAQWILALSLSGFRAVRQFSHVACIEVINSLLVKLEILRKNARVFSKQLQVEIELDQRTNERLNRRGAEKPIGVSKSTLELYKKLLVSQIGQTGIARFIKCIYTVDLASKLRDVLVDIRIGAAFSLVSNVLLSPVAFSGRCYLDLVYRSLFTSDEVTRLLLLRYISLSETELTDEQFGILVTLHESCATSGFERCCVAIESIFLIDVNRCYDGSVVLKHRNEPRFKKLLDTLVAGPNHILSILIASVFFPSMAIKDFTLSTQLSMEDLPPKYRNILIVHPVVATKKYTLSISDDCATDKRDFSKWFAEFSNLFTSLEVLRPNVVKNFITSLWPYTDIFSDIGNIVSFLCEGGDATRTSAGLTEQKQKLLLQIALGSLDRLVNNMNDLLESHKKALETLVTYAPTLLRLFKADHSSMTVVLQLIDMATKEVSTIDVNPGEGITASLVDSIKDLLNARNNGDDEASIDSIRMAVRCLCNICGSSSSAQQSAQALCNEVLTHLEAKETRNLTSLHCLLSMLHYFPLALDQRTGLISMVTREMENIDEKEQKLWTAIGYVLYEAEVYKCYKRSQKLDQEFSDFAKHLLSSLVRYSKTEKEEFHMHVYFCSIVSLVQISSLVGGLEELPDGMEQELYRILEHFLARATVDYRNKTTVQSKATNPLEKNVVTISNLFILGYKVAFHMDPLETATHLIEQFTKSLLPRLYCSGVSTLILLYITSACEPIAAEAGFYLRFLANFDEHILGAILLYSMVGVYESGYHDFLGHFAICCIKQLFLKNAKASVDPKKLSLDLMIISAVQHGLHCPSNNNFLDHVLSFVKHFKESGGHLNTAILHAQLGKVVTNYEPREQEKEKVWEILHSIGMQADDLLKGDSISDQDNGVIKRYLSVMKRINFYVDFLKIIQANHKPKTTNKQLSRALLKRNYEREPRPTVADDYPASISSGDAALDVSPIVMRTFTKSQFNPITGSNGPNEVPATAQGDAEGESDVTPVLDYQDTTEAGTPLSQTDSSLRYAYSFGYVSPSPSVFSPF